MTKRQRLDSAGEQVAVANRVRAAIVPPAHVSLTEEQMKFWDATTNQPGRDWPADDLEIAALLCRSLARLERETRLLDTEDSVIVSAKGAQMANPRLRIIGDMHAQVLKYRQDLRINDRGKNGERRDADKRRAAVADLDGRFERQETDDDLLAGMRFN